MYYLYGASGHGKVILEVIEASGNKVLGIFDDGENLPNSILEVPTLRFFPKEKWGDDNFLIISIGNNKTRKKIVNKFSVSYGIAIHPKSQLSSSAKIGEGTVLMAGSNINACALIGKHCIINTNSSVDHDCLIDDFVHISPNATITGGVSIGEGTHIGAGAIVIPGIKIGKWATIGAGAVIINDVPDYAIIVGNPGKVIKYKEESNG